MPFFDSHLHIHEDRESIKDQLPALLQKVPFMALMGTRENEWEWELDIVLKYNNNNDDDGNDVSDVNDVDQKDKKEDAIKSVDDGEWKSRIVIGFGIHPWFAHRVSSSVEWKQRIESLLERYPSFVGEIGIDHKATTPETGTCEKEIQWEVFTFQFELAIKTQKPVSVHCVSAFGVLFDYFRQLSSFPPRVALHSFSGAPEMARAFMRIPKIGERFYFGFSHVVNKRSPKTPKTIQVIPTNRILLESDHSQIDCVEEGLIEMTKVISQVKGWSYEETVEQTYRNAVTFFGFSNG